MLFWRHDNCDQLTTFFVGISKLNASIEASAELKYFLSWKILSSARFSADDIGYGMALMWKLSLKSFFRPLLVIVADTYLLLFSYSPKNVPTFMCWWYFKEWWIIVLDWGRRQDVLGEKGCESGRIPFEKIWEYEKHHNSEDCESAREDRFIQGIYHWNYIGTQGAKLTVDSKIKMW